jgi:hypothetical protein
MPCWRRATPAKRYPALQALLPYRTSHVEGDGTVAVAGVCYADEREHVLPYFAGASVLVVGSRQVPGRAWVHLADELAHDPDVLADPVAAKRLAGDAGGAGAGVGAADTTPRPHSGTGERADPSTSTLWGTAATGRIHPVCTVVSGDGRTGAARGLALAAGGGESVVERRGRRPAQTAEACL